MANDHEVCIWVYEDKVVAEINDGHENRTYLPGVPLDDRLFATSSMEEALVGADIIISVVPSHLVRKVLTDAAAYMPKNAIPGDGLEWELRTRPC